MLLPGRAWVKAGVAAVLLVGLLALVALGARGGHPSAHYHSHQRVIPAAVGNDLLTLLVIVYGIGLVILVIAFFTFRHEWIQPRSRWLRDLVVTLAMCAFFVLVFYRVFHARRGRHGAGSNHPFGLTNSGHTQTAGTLPQVPASDRSAHFSWQFAALLGGLAILTAAFFLLRRRPGSPAAAEAPVEEELGAAVDESIDDLRRERDPRRAVIGAYARMERVLRRHGRARRAAEAPYEYLARILADLRVRPEAVADLTDLFERAKFSTHEIDGGMKTQAIAALVAVRDDLERT